MKQNERELKGHSLGEKRCARWFLRRLHDPARHRCVLAVAISVTCIAPHSLLLAGLGARKDRAAGGCSGPGAGGRGGGSAGTSSSGRGRLCGPAVCRGGPGQGCRGSRAARRSGARKRRTRSGRAGVARAKSHGALARRTAVWGRVWRPPPRPRRARRERGGDRSTQPRRVRRGARRAHLDGLRRGFCAWLGRTRRCRRYGRTWGRFRGRKRIWKRR